MASVASKRKRFQPGCAFISLPLPTSRVHLPVNQNRRGIPHSPRCSLLSNVTTGSAAARVSAASLVVGGFLLGRKGSSISAASGMNANPYVMGGRLCGMVAFCIAASLLAQERNTASPTTADTTSSKFGASRASWDEEETGTAINNKSGASTKGGFVKAALGLGVRLMKDVCVPFLDAMRILLMDLKAPYRRGDAYFLTRTEASAPEYKYKYPAPLSSEEKAIEDVSKAAKRVAEGTRGGVKKAGDALRTLMDGFT